MVISIIVQQAATYYSAPKIQVHAWGDKLAVFTTLIVIL